MSKRTSQSNTLFNYFQSPKRAANGHDLNVNKSTSNSKPRDSKAPVHIDADPQSCLKKDEIPSDLDNNSNDESPLSKPGIAKKRKRIAIPSSDSDSDHDLANRTKKMVKEKQSKARDSPNVSLQSYSFNKFVTDSNKENIEENKTLSSTSLDVKKFDSIVGIEDTNWVHNNLDFLKPENIRDINKNKLDHPDYDGKTLYVPSEFLNKQTPAMYQWWDLKRKHFDCVLFFKVGKFYELYHMDAVIGVNNLGFSYMKGSFAHSGFPESAYGRMASSLVEQGFKVARVEQTETPEMMAQRCKSSGKVDKKSKVVNREICQVTTKATCVYGAQLPDAKYAFPCYMIAMSEKVIATGRRFGVCFIDTSIGMFHVGEFDDDKHCSKLLALFAEYPIGLYLTERGCIKSQTCDILRKALAGVREDKLTPKTQFFSAQHTIDVLAKSCYFSGDNEEFQWPLELQKLIENGYPKPEYGLALKALGACVWYLVDSELDIQILSMKKFEIYQPVYGDPNNDIVNRNCMVLDSITMENLSVLGSVGSLQKTLDYCETAFGKRLLQHWICRPLCVSEKILERQEAVKELYDNKEMLQNARSILKSLPDLERQVSKIHTFGNKFCATNHPDSRAILYEAKTYSKRKIRDLISTLQGFGKAQSLAEIFADCKTNFLRKLTQRPPKGKFLNLSGTLQFFSEAFDQQQAEAEGKIIPQSGVDEDFDSAEEGIEKINQELAEYLEQQEQYFGCKLSYFGSDKKRYQIEVPELKTGKVTKEFLLQGTKKGSKPAKRYTTPETRKLLADMIKAEDRRNKIVQDLNRRIFKKFSDRNDEWERTIHCLMTLDVICAFAEYTRVISSNACFPKILPFQDEPYINIENGIHPSTLLQDFVPNSSQIGVDGNPSIMLLTGPNMGGKSTLMRQVALITIMAQMGCAVPAMNCELSLVDRIFTRLGAHDDILHGQSTAMVELNEAAVILKHASKHSFVLVDELGRGTSTHDGNAIATAYLHKLTEIQCRTIFATHFHSLVEQFTNRKDIYLAHMACMAEEEQTDDTFQSVTLLYQLRKGICPKSYGFNAAKLAGVPKSVIQHAYDIACKMENIERVRKKSVELFLSEDPAAIRLALNSLKI